mmetsp:Transcript_8795/g.19994  ORF Transcript_8795/g.19994 Transcript_8795/m.19994 type:complete len:85 (+) Transcript_8795:272-526(+)
MILCASLLVSMAGARLLIRVNELSNSDVGSKLLSWECNAAELDKLSLALTGCLYIDDSLGSQLAGRSTSIWGTLAEDLPAGRIL